LPISVKYLKAKIIAAVGRFIAYYHNYIILVEDK